MSDKPFLISMDARKDLESIREYTIEKWGQPQWLKYKDVLRARMQTLANNPELGLTIDEISNSAYRFPDGQHVFYYLKRPKYVVFVGLLSSNLAPDTHLKRVKDIDSEI